MELINIIKDIHAAKQLGIILEAGCGATIANTLYQVEGASNTIFYSEQAYSKEYQQKKYFDKCLKTSENKIKSVSEDFIKYSITATYDDFLGRPEKSNFILSTTFQISSDNTKITHGYIGILSNNKSKIIHLSIPYKYTRKRIFDIIAEIGIKFLSNILLDTKYALEYVDKEVPFFGYYHLPRLRINLIQNLIDSTKETFLVLDQETKKFIRYEDFLRGSDGVILQKGSFNPLHEGHKEIHQQAKETFPNYKSALLFSLDRRDKESVSAKEMYERALDASEAGYNVIISKGLKFLDTLEYHNLHWSNKELVLPMGVDTINRLIVDEKAMSKLSVFSTFTEYLAYNFKNTKLLIFNRKNYEFNPLVFEFPKDQIIFNIKYEDTGISSTQLRTKDSL